jgi:hypothetical protein|tara:strand:+ start:750 stop:1253 length:504 start_codon:yes stop_codon:yes gene_type:complete
MSYQSDIYQPRLAAGQEYQDFLTLRLHSLGIILQPIQSKKYQYTRENLLGMEIKYDRRLAETRNLYIETHEKSDPKKTSFVNSGIYREDKCWLYGIGDYVELFIFSKKHLQRIDKAMESKNWPGVKRVPENETRTSKGFLLPRAFSLAVCSKYIAFTEDPPSLESLN